MTAQTTTRSTRSAPRRAAAIGALLAVGIVVLSACDAPATPAGKLYNAWKANNPSAATGDFTTHAAKTQMFSQPYAASTGWFFLKCDGAAGSTYCTWVNKIEGRLVLRIDNSINKVVSVERISLGSVEAGRTFHAWRVNDSASAAPYATSSARATLFSKPYKASDHWTPDGCEGAAGSLYCTFTNDAAKTIILRVVQVQDPKMVTSVSGTFYE